MRAVETKEARGSLRWIRSFVNGRTAIIDRAVQTACGLSDQSTIEWVSPLKNDDFAEYGDQAFLERLRIVLPDVPLKEFWSNRGPQWDALARTSSGEILLVEAKANIPEIVSPGTGANPVGRAKFSKGLFLRHPLHFVPEAWFTV